MNRTGNIDYNKYGVKDGRGFIPCSDKFVESFHLGQLVANDQVTKKARYLQLSESTKRLRTLLKEYGLTSAKVSATTLKKLPSCYDQQYKISCAEEEYGAVMGFLHSDNYNQHGVYFKDLDVACDFEGSFNKNDLVTYLVQEKGYRIQHSTSDYIKPTILLNEADVGRNCLTYMSNDGVRCHLYNKMVMMLEKKGLFYPVGQQWLQWVQQTDTRLAKARDATSQRGLTHVKVTFTHLPTNEEIETYLSGIAEIPNDLVYSTPHAATWKAYCDVMQHSLVLVDRQHNLGLVVYSCNEVTQAISGHLVKKWESKERWCLAKLLLSGTLPADVVEVSELRTALDCKQRDTVLCIQGQRYVRQTKDDDTTFPTRLTSNGCVYACYQKASKPDELLAKAGLIPHLNCQPQLAHQQGSKRSRIDLALTSVGVFNFAKGAVKRRKIDP